MIADILEEAEGMDLLDMALLVMGTVHLEELLDVAESAKALHLDMLPHDYDPYWSWLGVALGKLPE